MKDILRPILVLGAFALYYLNHENLDWYWFFVFMLVAVFISEIIPAPKKKNTKKEVKSNRKSNTNTPGTLKLKNPTDKELLTANFEELEGVDFERLVAMYYKDLGYKPVIVGGSGDHEVDLILTDPKENYKIAVQCKCWNTKNVGNDVILKLSGGKRVHKCLDAWCITTSDYTKAAKEAARGANIKLYNGLHVQDEIGSWQKKKAKQLNL